MAGTKDLRRPLTDSQLAVELLRARLVSEGQLKAAIDYQELVGGKLAEVVVKLGLVRPHVLDEFLQGFQKGTAERQGERDGALEIDYSRLKVHKRLLEKVPAETVERFGIRFYFPPPGTRAILLSSDRPVADDVLRQLRSLLGVEIQPIDLPPEVRAHSTASERCEERGGREERGAGLLREAPRGTEAPSSPEAPPPSREVPPDASPVLRPARAGGAPAPSRPPGYEGRSRPGKWIAPRGAGGGDGALLRALVKVLLRKGILTEEDLEGELEGPADS